MVLSRSAGSDASATSSAALAVLTLSTTSLPATAAAGSGARMGASARAGAFGSYPRTSHPCSHQIGGESTTRLAEAEHGDHRRTHRALRTVDPEIVDNHLILPERERSAT